MNHHGSMNRIYRLVWSRVRDAWVPAAETARGRGKSGSARAASQAQAAATAATAAAAVLSVTMAPLAHAAPTGGQIVSGKGSITASGTTTDVRQSSQTLSIDWLSFNVAPHETVDFIQPNASAIAVNRVGGTNGSEILGHLDANGQVYLINPNGVVFGAGSQVNVGGLVASTLDVSDASLGSAARSFSGSGAGSVVNEGTINAPGGSVALIGNHVSNQGVISAQLGTVALAAGSAVTLTFNGDSLVHLSVDRSVLNNLAENHGLIQADGGQVLMTAGAKDALLASVVNNTGVIEARTVEDHEGTITLLGGMAAGTVNVGGTLDASAANGGNGGFIETSAAHVEVADGTRITTAASRGLTGSWLIDPQDFTVAPSGGDITGAALSTELGTNNVTLQSSGGGTAGSGNVNVDDAVSWSTNNALTLTASNNINVNGSITASGSTASLVLNANTANGNETSTGTGTVYLGAGASITLSGANAALAIKAAATDQYASTESLGAGAAINLPNVSPTSTTALIINGTSYTVINQLGAPGSTTGTDLQGMVSGNFSEHYALGSNLDASATSNWNSGAGFNPIGSFSTRFTGIFDGLGHTIGGLFINRSANDVGLFGVTGSSAAIWNLGVGGGGVSGNSYVGDLVGYNYGGTINNSFASGIVTGVSELGGLVGVNSGSILNSHAFGKVSASGAGYAVGGLVGVNNSSISNSHAGGPVTGTKSVGGLVGVNDSGTTSSSSITGSNSYGTVNGSTYVGGLVGANYGSITTSYASGAVIGQKGAGFGGLVGLNSVGPVYAGSINYSYATTFVSVDGAHGVGGLVGDNNTSITNSYATGAVGLGADVGGLVGNNYGTISNSYATGIVSGVPQGGLAGANTGSITNSYWNTTTSGLSTSAGGEGLTSAQMVTVSNLSGFTFTTIPHAAGWVLVDANGTLNNASGAAGATFPMLASEYSTTITNAHQLQLIAMNGAANYTLGQYIDATATVNGYDIWPTSTGFVPISSFSGSFDGMGHTITGLTTNLTSASSDVGLFGIVSASGVVRNVGLVSGSTIGGNGVGSLVGLNYGTVSNSYSTNSVQATGNDLGGLVGINQGTIVNSHATGAVTTGAGYDGENMGGLVGWNTGTVQNSYATGAVSWTTTGFASAIDVGGLVGENFGGVTASYATGAVGGSGSASFVGGLVGASIGTIANSYATGPVTGVAALHVGGLVGSNGIQIYRTRGTITNSYATGGVAGSSYVGGLVGYNYGTASNSYASGSVSGSSAVGGLVGFNYGPVTNSYSVGKVSGSSNVGGLVGLNGSGGGVSTSFWDTTTSGQMSSAGGLGMSTANMQTQANFTSATTANGNVNPNWDFANTWVMYNGHTYPLLRSFMTPLTVTANGDTTTYSGKAFSGGNGVTYSVTPNMSELFGTVSYGGNSQGAVNVGTYAITPGGLYSSQQGYLINYASGTLTINQLASVAWVGGTTGNWSTASNWAGGAIPDLSNVAAVTIPKGTTVTYDAGVVGTTLLTSLSDAGKLVMAAGNLLTTGNLTAAGYSQSGGVLDVGGTLTIDVKAGVVTLGDIDAGALSITASKGTIAQLAGSAVEVTGATTLTADNGTGGLDAITLAQAGDSFGGTVTATGSAITLKDKSALTVVLDSSGASTLTSTGAMNVSGTIGTTLTTKTMGPKHTTTFGATTVGTSLNVTSTGAVTETASNILTVDGEGTTTIANPNVTVNGVKGVKIPAP